MMSMRRSRIFVGLAAMALTVAGLVTAPSAGAAPDKADKAGAGGRHCTVNVKTAAVQCFGTFREAIANATAGRVTDANLSAEAAGADAKTVAQLNDGYGIQLVIGIEYYWQNFNQGPESPDYSFTASGPVSCTGPTTNIDYRLTPLPNFNPPNWNNNIRSFQGFSNCWQRMWDTAACTGLLLNYTSSSADMGAGRDRTECIDWS